MQAIKEMLKQTYPSTIGSNIDENGNVILSNFTLEKNEYIKDNEIFEHRIRTLTEKRRNDIL